MRNLFIALVVLASTTAPAVADPVSIGIAISAAVASINFAQLAIGLAISVGLSFAAQLLTKKPELENDFGSSAINKPEVRYNTRQATPSKRIIVGTAQVGGALFFEQVKPPYLYNGILICASKVSAFRRLWVGVNEIRYSQFTPNTILFDQLLATGDIDYTNRLKVSLRLGDATQAIDPLLHEDFGSLASTFRQQGIATAVFRYHFGGGQNPQDAFNRLWGQVQRPNPLLLVDGVAVYDPRDPLQLVDDPNTWQFSNNASLVQAYYLTQSFGGRIPTSKIDWVKVAAAANYDDELVVCADGTFIKRYTIDGVFNLSQSPAEVLRAMLSANRGMVLESGGTTWVSSSRPRVPIATIHDGILTGAVDYRAAKPKRDLVNRCKARFVAEDREYQTADGPVLSRLDLQAADGEILDATLELPFTLDHRRAQRLQKAYLADARLGRTITCRADVSLLCSCPDELVGNSVTFDSALFPQMNGTYLVKSVGFSEAFSSLELSLIEYDPLIETDWDADADEQEFVLAELDVS